jgi:hypothetical protein
MRNGRNVLLSLHPCLAKNSCKKQDWTLCSAGFLLCSGGHIFITLLKEVAGSSHYSSFAL